MHVRVLPPTDTSDCREVAVEMVKDALASRAARWQSTTFVTEGDVHAR